MSFVAAVVQAFGHGFDLTRSLSTIERLAASASEMEAELVVFPEAFVGGYPKGTSFGSFVGGRSEAGRDEFETYMQSAVVEHGEASDALCEIAARFQVLLVVGVVERSGSTLYNSIWFFDPDTGYLGSHRKVMPTGAERLMWGFADASTMPVFETRIGRLGAVTCWENYMPLLRTAMYQKGIELWCAPTADSRDSWLASMRHIAREGHCFVFSACQHMTTEQVPDSYERVEGLDGVLMAGASCIVDPLGNVIAGPTYDSEAVLTATIDLRQVRRAAFDFDPVGHYARPDLFRLYVDDRPKRPATFATEQPTDR